jgi:hypothetical protein
MMLAVQQRRRGVKELAPHFAFAEVTSTSDILFLMAFDRRTTGY